MKHLSKLQSPTESRRTQHFFQFQGEQESKMDRCKALYLRIYEFGKDRVTKDD